MSSRVLVLPVLLAGAAWFGALQPHRGPWPVAALAVGGALLARRPTLLVLSVLVLASLLSGAAWAGLEPPARSVLEGEVVLVGDPEPGLGGQVRADVRLADGRRVEAVARGPASGLLAARAAGERVEVVGRLGPPPEGATWLVPRHVAGRLDVQEVVAWRSGDPPSRLANQVRRTLAQGARSLGPDHRALFAGMVLGDDRAQSAAQADAFRAAGLGHLLAVSGQNVAFVLVLVHPLTSRLGTRARLALVLVVLGSFVVLVRAEPSVLRAVAMAGVAAIVTSSGRRAPGLVALALAVAALVLVDPLLVHSLGFRLSVAASAGILLLARPLADRLPGPRPLAAALGVTVAAQVAVAPLLVPTFGGLPVAALPANVLAVPAAGPVTTWGLTAGLVAGVVPARAAAVLHLPTRALLEWIEGIADVAVRLPLGDLGEVHVVLAVAAGAGALALWVRRRRVPAAVGLVALLVVLAHPAWALRTVDVEAHLSGGVLWRRGGGEVLVLERPTSPETVLAELRSVGATELDLVIARTRGATTPLAALRARHPGLVVRQPEDPGPGVAEHLRVGGVAVVVTPVEDRLEVRRTSPDQAVTVVR